MSERSIWTGRHYSGATGARVFYGALGLVLALFVPPVLVPLGVPAGTSCDLLVAGCQLVLGILLLGIVLAVAVPREGSPWRDVALVMLVVGFYWVVVRLGVSSSILLVVILGWLWISAAAPAPDSTRGSRPARDSSETRQPARRAYLILVLLVCVPVEAVFLLWPIGPGAPMSEYAMFLLAVAATVVICVWLGLHMDEPGLHSTRRGRAIRDSGETNQPPRRAHRILVLLVCAGVVECLLILRPDGPKPPVSVYAMLLITVVGALVVYIHLRLALLEMALSRRVSESTEEEQKIAQMSTGESGTNPEDTSGHTEEN